MSSYWLTILLRMVPIQVHLWSLQEKRKRSVGSKNMGHHLPRQLLTSADVCSLSCNFCCVQWQIQQVGAAQPPELRVEVLVFTACQSLGVYKWILGGFVKHTLRRPRKVGWRCCMGSSFPYIWLFRCTLCLENLIDTTNIKSEKSKD